MRTEEILAKLCSLPESPWQHFYGHGNTITDRDLSRLLRPYGIRSKDVGGGPISEGLYSR
jgi:Protein of unknown function (DUF3631)